MLIPILKPDAVDISTIAYRINITIEDVDPGIFERLVVAIERYLRGGAQRAIIARNLTFPAKFELACAIRYPIPVQKRILKKHLRSRAIPASFGDRNLKGRTLRLHVDAKAVDNLDDTTFDCLKDLWSKPPWNLEFEGRGAGLKSPLS